MRLDLVRGVSWQHLQQPVWLVERCLSVSRLLVVLACTAMERNPSEPGGVPVPGRVSGPGSPLYYGDPAPSVRCGVHRLPELAPPRPGAGARHCCRAPPRSPPRPRRPAAVPVPCRPAGACRSVAAAVPALHRLEASVPGRTLVVFFFLQASLSPQRALHLTNCARSVALCNIAVVSRRVAGCMSTALRTLQ